MANQDIDLKARTMVAENSDASANEYAAIANVMRNRLLSGSFGGNTMSQVLFAPHQFTPWGLGLRDENGKLTNHPMNVDQRTPAYQSAYRIAGDVMSGQSKDSTNGAVFYYAPKTQAKQGQPTPPFAQGRKGMTIGQHTFYGPLKPQLLSDSDTALLQKYEPSVQPTHVAGEPQAAPKQQQLSENDNALLDKYQKGSEEPDAAALADKQMEAIKGQDTLEGIVGASMRDDPEHTRQSILAGAAVGIPIAAGGGLSMTGVGGPLMRIISRYGPGAFMGEAINHYDNVKALYNALSGRSP